MAGGLGRRLAPYTNVLPKPLMPLTDRPIIDVILRQLGACGIERIDVCVGHLGSLIESWIREQGDYGVPIHFTYENEPLGTAGALATLPDLAGTFIAMNGDILTTLPFDELVKEHTERGATATVAVTDRVACVDYGVIRIDADGMLVGLEEKPQIPYTVSMGVYAFEASIVDGVSAGEHVHFPDLLLRTLERGGRVATFRYDGYWRDIGSRDDYEAAIAEFGADPSRFMPRGAGVTRPL